MGELRGNSLCADNVINFVFMGEKTKKIAQRFEVSDQTVRNRIRDFVYRAEEVGLMEAAEEYEVEEEVKNLRKLAISIASEDVTLEGCINGSNIYDFLKKMNIKDSHLKEFLGTFYQHSVSKGIPPSNMGDLLHRFNKLCDETGMDYPVLVKKWEQTRNDKQTLDNTVKDLQKKTNDLEQNLNSKLDAAGVTESQLEDYIKTKILLESHTLNIDDQGKGLKVLDELKSLGHDLEIIIPLIEEHGSLEKKNKENNDHKIGLEKQLRELDNSVITQTNLRESLESRNKVLQEMNTRLKNPLDALGELNNLDLQNQDIVDLRDLITESGSTIPALKKQLEKLKGIDNHVNIRLREQTSLENHNVNLEATKTKLQQDITYLEGRNKKLAEDSINTLEAFTQSLQSIRHDFQTEISAPETGLRPVVMKEFEEVFDQTRSTFEVFSAEYHDRVEDMKNEMVKLSGEVEKTKETVFHLGYTTGQIKTIQHITNLIQGNPLPPNEKKLALASILDLVSLELFYENRIDEGTIAGNLRDKILHA